MSEAKLESGELSSQPEPSSLAGSNEEISALDAEIDSDPYVVEFKHNDPENPMNFSSARKWLYTGINTMTVLAVTLTSSAYSGSILELETDFHGQSELYSLGVALFVLGFAVGPALWAPLSELYGRRILYMTTLGAVTALVAGTAGGNSLTTVLVLRFLAGTFGASPLTNAGGVVADTFPAAQRGLGMSIFSAAPFLGPVLGPIIGGFISMNVGWRWVQGVCAIFVGVSWIIGSLVVPETYAPVLLRRRARKLAAETGKPYISVIEKASGKVSFSAVITKALRRPWVLLFREPIVLIASIYLAILYGTMYMFMTAFPIVYQRERGWNEGIGGLSFLGVMVGMLIGLVYTIIDNKRFAKLGRDATPEDRLPPCIVGAIALPIGLFAFAWTNFPSVHWSASIILAAPFGFGMVPVFLSCLNYLVDAYTIYAASVLAATAMLRAFIGFAFPLFTTQMYDNLGIHWASSIPAFLCVLCLPFPLAMYRYGKTVRMKCKYAKEAALLMAELKKER